MKKAIGCTLVVAAVLSLSACNGPGSSAGRATAPAAAPAPAPGSTVWSHPGTPAAPSSATVSATSAAGGPASAPGTSKPAAPSSPGVLIKGTVPPDPTSGFSGLLFLTGERMAPGSTVLVSFGGVPLAVLPAVFFSSEVVGVDVTLAVPGDYAFTVVAPDGTTSAPLGVKVVPASASPVTAAPDVHMIWPPAFDTSFVGTAWIMGDHFLPGAFLEGTGPLGPFALPLVYLNERTLGWTTATPLAGTYSLQVWNPVFTASKTLTIAVGAPTAPAGLPAPGLSFSPTEVLAPFFGSLRVFGSHFLPGAALELTDAAGTIQTTPLVFIASDEVWWMLVYPTPGTYKALIRNPDGQATPSWSFVVK